MGGTPHGGLSKTPGATSIGLHGRIPGGGIAAAARVEEPRRTPQPGAEARRSAPTIKEVRGIAARPARAVLAMASRVDHGEAQRNHDDRATLTAERGAHLRTRRRDLD